MLLLLAISYCNCDNDFSVRAEFHFHSRNHVLTIFAGHRFCKIFAGSFNIDILFGEEVS